MGGASAESRWAGSPYGHPNGRPARRGSYRGDRCLLPTECVVVTGFQSVARCFRFPALAVG